MAEDLVAHEHAEAFPAAPLREAELAEPQRREPSAVYRYRFAIAYLVLAVVAGVAVGTAIMLVDRPAEEPAAAWSRWQPTGPTSTFDDQIADHVSGRYRLPSGETLVGILAGPPQVSTRQGDVPIRAVAIQNDPEGVSDDVSIVATDDSLMYTLCGLGEQCSIREGEPSEERMRLLRREALELALYSFKYVDGLDSVIALLPPNLGDAADTSDDTTTALFFQKKHLADALERPLEQTLTSPAPPRAAELGEVEGLTIDRLTQARLFRYEFTQAPSGGAIIVLAPVAAR